MRYVSLFSGIEAATVAWAPLGWTPVAFSEIEPFPCAVLKHHYPDVPNLGDVTGIDGNQFKGKADVVCAGFPCQDVSVAGRRKGLQDDDGTSTRSGLFFDACRIADESEVRWFLLENVPGLFSSNGGKDFAVVVGEMAGVQLSVPADGWANSGFVLGPKGLVEWCVLDAQYFGLAQRRLRVFIIRDSGNWFDRPPVLLEPESLRGDSAPSREAGEGTAADVAQRIRSGGAGTERVGDTRGQDNVVAFKRAQVGKPYDRTDYTKDVAGTQSPYDHECVAYSLRGEGHDASEDGTGRGVPLVFGRNNTSGPIDTAPACQAHGGPHGRQDFASEAFVVNLRGREGGAMPELDDVASLRAADGGSSRSYVFDPNQVTSKANRSVPKPGVSHTLPGVPNAPVAFGNMAVRRLTPTECARLQGFPDDYLDITYRKKPAADGPKYKALGNSWAVPVVRWIGERISAEAAQGKLFV